MRLMCTAFDSMHWDCEFRSHCVYGLFLCVLCRQRSCDGPKLACKGTYKVQTLTFSVQW